MKLRDINWSNLPYSCKWTIQYYGGNVIGKEVLNETIDGNQKLVKALESLLVNLKERYEGITDLNLRTTFREEVLEHLEARIDESKKFIQNLQATVYDIERMTRGEFVNEDEELAFQYVYQHTSGSSVTQIKVNDAIITKTFNHLQQRLEDVRNQPLKRKPILKRVEMMKRGNMEAIVCAECDTMIQKGDVCVSKRGKGTRRHYCISCSRRLNIV